MPNLTPNSLRQILHRVHNSVQSGAAQTSSVQSGVVQSNTIHPSKAIHVQPSEHTTVRELVAATLQCSPERVTTLLGFGAVYLHRGRRFERLSEDAVVETGFTVRIHPMPRRFPVDFDWRARIRYECDDFLVIDKPRGIPVHASLDNCFENLAIQIRVKLGIPVLVTHRIDTISSGLVVLAKHLAAQKRINTLFAEGHVLKRYRALLPHSVECGSHVHHMVPGERAPRLVTSDPSSGSKPCELIVEKSEPAGEHFLTTIRLLTGRTHQIRAQMQALGSPLVGDSLYGSSHPAENFFLCCSELGWKGWHIRLDYSRQLASFKLALNVENGERL